MIPLFAVAAVSGFGYVAFTILAFVYDDIRTAEETARYEVAKDAHLGVLEPEDI